MTVPEASVHEDRDSIARQQDVRLSRQVRDMEAKAKAGREKVLADV
jgi:hypothetical protein